MLTSKTINEIQPIVEGAKTYKSFCLFFYNILPVCCGSFFFGITLSYFSIFPIEQIKTEFKITIGSEVAKGIFNAIVPAGAFIGAFLSSIFIQKLTRRNALLTICAIGLTGGVLTLVPYFAPMAIGRFIEGIAVGLYSSMCPLIINQLVPAQLAGRLGIANQLFIILGIQTSNILTLAVSTNNQPGDPITFGWQLIFGIPIITALIQGLLLLFTHKFQTPKYLFLSNRQQEARQLIQKWYLPEYVEIVYDRFQRQAQTITKQSSLITSTHQQFSDSNSSKSSIIAIIMGFHLALLQQFCGTNLVVMYCGDIFSLILPQAFIKPSRILLQSVKFIGCFGAAYFIRTLGRKTLLQIGSIAIGSILLIISICFIANTLAAKYIIVGVLFCFTLTFGFTLGPIIWMYIPQILSAKWVPYTTMMNWIGCMIVVLLFPIVQEAMGTSIYIFIFLSLWCYGSAIINHFFLVQTKNKQRAQINEQFQSKCK